MYSEAHSCTLSLASLPIFAAGGSESFIMRPTLAIGRKSYRICISVAHANAESKRTSCCLKASISCSSIDTGSVSTLATGCSPEPLGANARVLIVESCASVLRVGCLVTSANRLRAANLISELRYRRICRRHAIPRQVSQPSANMHTSTTELILIELNYLLPLLSFQSVISSIASLSSCSSCSCTLLSFCSCISSNLPDCCACCKGLSTLMTPVFANRSNRTKSRSASSAFSCSVIGVSSTGRAGLSYAPVIGLIG